jgi:dTDP-4-dehydrorhamnose reductase
MMERTLLLLGGTGKLGRELLGRPGTGWTIRAPGRAELDLASATREDFDRVLAELRPTAVLNAAALSNVEECETRREEAAAVNGTGPGLLAEACTAAGVPLVHISSDYVFGDPGRQSPDSTDAPHCPVQHYGVTKALGERLIGEAGGQTCIVRVSWLFGVELSTFEAFVLDQVERGVDPVGVMTWQRSRPTYTPALADWLLALTWFIASGGEAPPALHPAGGPWASRAEWARQILDAYGHPDREVEEQPGEIWVDLRARRPVDSRLDSATTLAWAQEAALPRLGDWREWLKAAAKHS